MEKVLAVPKPDKHLKKGLEYHLVSESVGKLS